MSDILPQGLQFLQLGWWISHVLIIWLVYGWAYRKGRTDEKRALLLGLLIEASKCCYLRLDLLLNLPGQIVACCLKQPSAFTKY